MKRKFLAAVLLTGALLLPVRVNADTVATVGLAQTQQAGVGQTVEVGVNISAAGGGYHAFDLEVVYDQEKLEFVSGSKPDGNTQYWEENGALRIAGYGEAKSGGLTLTFRALAAGSAEVSIRQAKVDDHSGAPRRDAPDAVLTNATVSVTITGEYPVTLDDGLTADSRTAKTGEDYVFRAGETGNYTYAPTATVAGEAVTVKNGADNTYYISGADIRGPVVITANRKAKTYSVTFTGSGGTGEKTATYNQDYSFTVAEKTGYTCTVKITIGGDGYSGYECNGNRYTIPGTDITGNLIVSVTYRKSGTTSGSSGSSTTTSTSKKTTTTSTSTSSATVKTVTFLGSGASDAKGEAKATANQDYTFTLNKKKGFSYNVTAKVGEVEVTCTENEETSVFTIPGKSVTGNLTITIVKEAAPEITVYLTLDRRYLYLVTFDGELEQGQLPLYGGRTMVQTDIYGGYGYLVVSSQEETDFEKEARLAITIGTGETAEKAEYGGDVDKSGKRDRQDAVLVQNLYNAEYLLTDLEMVQFLNGDINGDRILDIRDAAAAVNLWRQEEET